MGAHDLLTNLDKQSLSISDRIENNLSTAVNSRTDSDSKIGESNNDKSAPNHRIDIPSQPSNPHQKQHNKPQIKQSQQGQGVVDKSENSIQNSPSVGQQGNNSQQGSIGGFMTRWGFSMPASQQNTSVDKQKVSSLLKTSRCKVVVILNVK